MCRNEMINGIKDYSCRKLDMPPIGYIVQYSNEEDYTVYHGFAKLHRNFSDALHAAKELSSGFLEMNDELYDGPFKAYNPTKGSCDTQGSVLVFESLAFIVWIDCVID